ncbi:MAG: transporter [Dethiosulfovibrio peptidovorans]|nr:MAG: transporter [Dethiosulfovibrio peptidovorans]
MWNGALVVLPLGIVMVVGWWLRRFQVLSSKGVEEMNRTLYWVVLPAILFRATVTVDPIHFTNFAFMAALYGPFLILPVFAWGLARLRGFPRERLAVSVLVSVRGNNVFLGLPVITVALGEAGLVWYAVYMALALVVYQLISIVSVQIALSGSVSLRTLTGALKKLMINPLVLACVAGVIGAFIGFRLPSWLDQSLCILGHTGSGVALVGLGASLKLGNLLSSLGRVWNDLLVRLILSPLLTWGALSLFSLDPMLVRTSVLMAAMPAAVDNFVLAQGMGMDHEAAGEIIVASTVWFVATTAFWLYLLGL